MLFEGPLRSLIGVTWCTQKYYVPEMRPRTLHSSTPFLKWTTPVENWADFFQRAPDRLHTKYLHGMSHMLSRN